MCELGKLGDKPEVLPNFSWNIFFTKFKVLKNFVYVLVIESQNFCYRIIGLEIDLAPFPFKMIVHLSWRPDLTTFLHWIYNILHFWEFQWCCFFDQVLSKFPFGQCLVHLYRDPNFDIGKSQSSAQGRVIEVRLTFKDLKVKVDSHSKFKVKLESEIWSKIWSEIWK